MGTQARLQPVPNVSKEELILHTKFVDLLSFSKLSVYELGSTNGPRPLEGRALIKVAENISQTGPVGHIWRISWKWSGQQPWQG